MPALAFRIGVPKRSSPRRLSCKPAREDAMKFAIVLAVLVFVGLYTWWHYQRINAMVAVWARSNGYKLLEVHRWYLTFPPIGMLLTTSREQSRAHQGARSGDAARVGRVSRAAA